MSTALATLVVKLTGDVSEFDQAMANAGGSLEKIGGRMQDVGSSLTKGLTLPLAAAGTAAVLMANQFNSGMANVASLSEEATAKVAGWGPAVQQMAVEVGKSTTDLTGGLYQVVSAFGATNDSLDILEINARAAAAGLSTTEEAIALTSAVTKAYGDTSAAAVQSVADMAMQTVSLGQTTFPELAASIGRVTPLASSLGVEMGELFGVMATATGVTGGAAEVSTQLRGVLQSLMAPTDAMTQLMTEYGFESGQAMLESMGLQGTIEAIVAAAEASGMPLQAYISSIEGQTLAMALAGPLADDFSNKIAAMGESAGAADRAFQAQTQGVNAVGFAMQQAAVQVQVWGQQIGQALLPAVQMLMEKMQPLVDWISQLVTRFAELDPKTQMIIIGIAGLAAALGPVLVVGGMVVSSIGAIMGVLGGLLLPIGLVVAAVAGLAMAWQTNFGGIQEKTQAVIGFIQPYITQFVTAVTTLWNSAWPQIQVVFQAAWTAVQGIIQTVIGIIGPTIMGFVESARGSLGQMSAIVAPLGQAWQMVQPIVLAVLQALGAGLLVLVGVVVGVVNGIVSALGPLVQGFVGAVQGIVTVIQGLATFFSGFFDLLKALFEGNTVAVHEALNKMGEGIRMIWEGIVTTIVSLVTGLVTAVIEFVRGLVEGVITFFTNLYQTLVGGSIVPDMVNGIINWFTTLQTTLMAITDAIRAFIEAIWTAIAGFLDTTWQTIVAMVTAALQAWQSINDAIMSAIQAFIDAIWNAILAFLTTTWQAIVTLVTTSMETARNIIETITNAVKAFWEATWNAIKAFTESLWNAMQAFIQSTISAIQNAITTFVYAIQALWTAFTSTLMSIWQNAWSVIQNIMEAGKNIITGIANAIVSAIFGAFNQDWGSIGRGIVDGIGNALQAGLSWVADAARRIAEAALEAARRALGLNSPSREFMAIGRGVIEGFTKPWDDLSPVQHAIVRVVDEGAINPARQAMANNVNRSINIGNVNMAGANGLSVLRQFEALGIRR